MDRIVIPGMRTEARVGVGEQERAEPQEILVDVELYLPLGRAAATDEISATVDYAEVCVRIDVAARARPYRLIEALAGAIAGEVLGHFDVAEVVVRVRKPAALRDWGVPYAAVELRRSRDA